jgi:hypothetical protein
MVALQSAERNAYVSMHAEWEDIKRATNALNDIATNLRAFARSHSWVFGNYCKLMRFDLETASRALFGLAHRAGEDVSIEVRKNYLNIVYRSLNAYSHLSADELIKLDLALENAKTSNDRSEAKC